MTAARRSRLPVLLLGIALAGCTPPYIDEAWLPFAKDYYKGCARDACPMALEAMSLDQLYAVHLYGRRFHPWRGMSGEFARRGPAAIPFLRAKLAAARDGGEVGSIFEIFREMRRIGTFEPRSDPQLIALVEAAAGRNGDDYAQWVRESAERLKSGAPHPRIEQLTGL